MCFLKNEAGLVELLKHLEPHATDPVTQQQEGGSGSPGPGTGLENVGMSGVWGVRPA